MNPTIRTIIGIIMFLGLFIAGIQMPEFIGTQRQLVTLVLSSSFFGVLAGGWIK